LKMRPKQKRTSKTSFTIISTHDWSERGTTVQSNSQCSESREHKLNWKHIRGPWNKTNREEKRSKSECVKKTQLSDSGDRWTHPGDFT
jgi:hypothetical protein